jgi:hypothetical protein
MKKIIIISIFIVAFTITLTACQKKDEDINAHNNPHEIKESVIDVPPVIIIEEEIQPDNNMAASYLTGELKDKDIVNRRPLAVTLVNNESTLPHYGISQADIIYEAQVEGRITRLLAFFEEYDDLDRIGPVRGARDYFIYEAMGKDALFSHWGLAVLYCSDLINGDKVDSVTPSLYGVDVGADVAYKRVERPGYAVEHTGYLDINGYEIALEQLGYRRNYSDNFVPQFTFVSGDAVAEYSSYPTVTKLYPGSGLDLVFKGGTNFSGYGYFNHPSFVYSFEDRLYYRFQYGKEMVDEFNNEQLAFTNVIFQYAYGEVRDAHDYLAFRVHGTGEAKIFTGGKMIDGTWSRYGGDLTPAKFYDMNGDEIVLNRGKTWICLIWDEYAEYVSYE